MVSPTDQNKFYFFFSSKDFKLRKLFISLIIQDFIPFVFQALSYSFIQILIFFKVIFDSIWMKYDPKLVMIFNRFLPNLMNIWREVRSEFKRNQSSNGLIKPANFVEVLNSAGINLPSDEFKVIIKTFNRSGNGIKFDDFLRTCLVSFGI